MLTEWQNDGKGTCMELLCHHQSLHKRSELPVTDIQVWSAVLSR
jgi:hypothetical protein